MLDFAFMWFIDAISNLLATNIQHKFTFMQTFFPKTLVVNLKRLGTRKIRGNLMDFLDDQCNNDFALS